MNRFLFVLFLLLPLQSGRAVEPVEFDTGRPQPQKNGMPVLGSGLAMSGGYFRGVPRGELSGWTISLWFYAEEDGAGDLFNIVRNAKQGDVLRLRLKDGELIFQGQRRKDQGFQLKAENVVEGKWQNAVITYAQESGPQLYLNGKHAGSGKRGWLGYATLFDNYHFGAFAKKDGSFGEYFEGLIDDFSLYNRPLSAAEVEQIAEGKEIEDGLIGFNDFENVSHRDFAWFSESDRDEAYLDEGKRLYELNCIACHSKDGKSPPPNPLSRIFTKHKMENGGDPLSIFRTITYGFRNMMPAPQLNPEERYKVIHYIRERMVKPLAPELYVKVDDNYTETMPQSPEGSGEEAARIDALARTGYLRDYGKALISPVQGRSAANSSHNALTIDLGNETTISYDLGTMSSIGAWQGGFLNFSNTLHHKLRAPGLPTSRDFQPIPGADSWRWAWDGRAENRAPDISPDTVWPEEQIRYRGHYPTVGDGIVISYSVQQRGVLENPLLEGAAIHRRLTIEPGENTIEAVVLSLPNQVPIIEGNRAKVGEWEVVLQGEGAKLRITEKNELALQIPPSDRKMNLTVALGKKGISTTKQAVDLSTFTNGDSRRWTTTHTMKGKQAVSSFQSYALDSVPVPLKNKWNTWMRTSSLAFFPDGRLAVGTLSGDIWIVSGIDDELQNVTWQRFAAGLYEPMGMKVVDGVLTVGCRGRIVKLHDYNNDGEADFYEAFHNERQPAPGWHAYNFDLEVGDDGSYYYARTGGFSMWSIPGGLVRVSADGKKSEVLGVGMRVPNGIGLLPDGRVTYGDNQGTYVPASKIVIGSKPGSFLGAGKWDQREGNYDPAKIVDPIVYMPQELDSSSGGQLWVEKDERFGPLSGQYFHTSFGRARTMYIMLDDLGDVVQGAVFSLPLPMESGTMRVAKNPVDGQLYYSGLTGWQAGATREGSIQRLRYTGGDGLYLIDAKARKGRLELSFNKPVESIDTTNWKAEMWNYRWSKGYGSPHFKVTKPGVQGSDELELGETRLEDGGKKVVISAPGLQPCHTLKLDFSVGELKGPVYFTVHRLVD